MHRMRRLVVLGGLALAALTGLSQQAPAALLMPNAGRAYPDVAADINGVVNYTYDPGSQTGNFTVTNTPYLIAGGPTSSQEFDIAPDANGIRQQSLNITLDQNGNLVQGASNTYSLYGTVTTNGQTFSGLLLSGTPTGFGSQDLTPVGIQGASFFDVNMNITGGALAPYFGPDAYMRIAPELQSTFTGSFSQNFSAAKATSNTRAYHSPHSFPIPEPTTLLVLLAGGGFGMFHRYRRRLARGL
jgi:hypothetical protein